MCKTGSFLSTLSLEFEFSFDNSGAIAARKWSGLTSIRRIRERSPRPIIPHENPLANYRYVEVYVKSVLRHVVLRYHDPDGGLKLKPVRFSGFPSFAMCSSVIGRKFNVSDEWEFQLTFNGTPIGHDTNLAFLESSGEKPIDVVPGRLLAYDIYERQDFIWTHPSWTVEDLIAKVSSGPKSEL
jgi:hypothetical protein